MAELISQKSKIPCIVQTCSVKVKKIWPGRSPGTFTYWDWYRFWRCRNKGAALIGKQHDCKQNSLHVNVSLITKKSVNCPIWIVSFVISIAQYQLYHSFECWIFVICHVSSFCFVHEKIIVQLSRIWSKIQWKSFLVHTSSWETLLSNYAWIKYFGTKI